MSPTDAPALRFTVLRRFHVEGGNGEPVAIFFWPMAPRTHEDAEQQTNQARLKYEVRNVPASPATSNVVGFRARARGALSHD